MTQHRKEQKQRVIKLKRSLLVLLLSAVLIGTFTLAVSANKKTTENIALLHIPEYTIHYLPGGPARFSKQFDAVDNEKVINKIDTERYYWSTVIVSNKGAAEAKEPSIIVDTAVPYSYLFIESPEEGPKIMLERDKHDSTKATLNLDRLGKNKTAYLFIGFDKEVVKQTELNSDNWWSLQYKRYLEKIFIKSGKATAEMFGYAASNFTK